MWDGRVWEELTKPTYIQRVNHKITDGDEEDSTTALAAPPLTLQPPIGELNTEQAPPIVVRC